MRKLILLTGLMAMLLGNQACGWRLRGQIDLPPVMERTLLKGSALYSELGVLLQNKLAGAGANLVDSPDQATAVLHILLDKVDRRVLSVDASGRAREYELNYILRFRLEDSAGTILVPEQTVSTTRELSFDANNVLSTSDEQNRLEKEMVRYVVQQMFMRINTSLMRDG